MKTVNIHEAKTNLSRLIEEAVAGEAFVVAKAGKPMVRVTRIAAPEVKRLGFLQGQGAVPADFDDLAEQEIQALFEGPA